MILSDLELLRKIFNDMKHCTVSATAELLVSVCCGLHVHGVTALLSVL